MLRTKCMRVNFTFLKGVKVEEDVREYVEKKVETAGKVLGGDGEANVEISQDSKRNSYLVEVTIQSGRDSFRAEGLGKTIESAIDEVEEKLQEQIRDSKGKKLALKRRGARSIKKKKVIDAGARF